MSPGKARKAPAEVAPAPAAPDARRGEIWWMDLEPTRGREQQKERPVLILSIDALNTSEAGLVIGLPLTTTSRGLPSHAPISAAGTGLKNDSFIMCDQIRALSKERLVRRIGRASPATMRAIETLLKRLLGL